MSSTFFGEPWLHGMESLVELRLQQFLLVGNKGGGSKFNLPNFIRQPISPEDYAALAASVHRFLEPGKFYPDVKRVFVIEDSEGKASEVKVGPVSFAELLERDPTYCQKLNRYLDNKSPLNSDILGRITLQHARLDEDYSAGRYELVIRGQPARNPTLTYNKGEKFDDQITEFKNNASGQQWWDAEVFRSFDWVPPVGDLTARELLWVLLFNKWHGLVLRAELARAASGNDVQRKIARIAEEEGQAYYNLLGLYERLSEGSDKEFIADKLIAQGFDLVTSLENQCLVPRDTLIENDVHDVIRRLRKYEKARIENRAKVGFALVSMRIVSQ